MWERLGRFLVGDGTGTGHPRADLTAAFRRAYPMSASDTERMRRKLDLILAGDDKKMTVREWIEKAATYPHVRNGLLADAQFCADHPDIMAALCKMPHPEKARLSMGDTRLGNNMLAVAREDGPSDLMASIRPALPGLRVHPCGDGGYGFLASLMEQPPRGTFAVVIFRNAPIVTADELVLNLSSAVIRSNSWLVDRERLLESRDALAGIPWEEIEKAAALLDRLDRAATQEAIKEMKDLRDRAGMDERALRLVPERRTAAWEILKRLHVRTAMERAA